jgi:phage antirepressor YoqD-like protein
MRAALLFKGVIMNELTTERTMTVKEVAEVLGLDVRTIQIKAKELFPNKVIPREESRFNEIEVTAIKNACEKKFAVETKEDKKQILKRAFEILNDENEELRQKILQDAPKVENYEAFLSAENWQTMNDVAHVLNIGRNTLFDKLRYFGVLMADNTPYQCQMSSGKFKVIEKPINFGDKTVNKKQTLISPKGIEYIRSLIK